MNKTDEALAKILTTLADKFGTTVDHLYAIMIKQALIDGVESILAIIVFTILFVVLYTKLNRWMAAENKKNPSRGWRFDDNPFLVVVTIVVGFLLLIVVLVCGTNAIDCFLNPEYYAIHQILKQ